MSLTPDKRVISSDDKGSVNVFVEDEDGGIVLQFSEAGDLPTTPVEGGVYMELPPPPDGGWGWVIVFACFMCNLILDGISYSFGVMLDELVTYFDEPKAKIAWAGSLLSGVCLIIGPIVSGLIKKYGCRPVSLAGSFVSFAAFGLSTLSPSVGVLIFTYGIMGGIGYGLLFLPSIVCVSYYFEEKRALATAIAVCGSGIGASTMAPIARLLLELYGWQGCILIFSAINLHCMVFAALMRPLEAIPIAPEELVQGTIPVMDNKSMADSLDSDYFSVQKTEDPARPSLRVALNPELEISSNLLVNYDDSTKAVDILPTITESKLLTEKDIELHIQASEASKAEDEMEVQNLIKSLRSLDSIQDICNQHETDATSNSETKLLDGRDNDYLKNSEGAEERVNVMEEKNKQSIKTEYEADEQVSARRPVTPKINILLDSPTKSVKSPSNEECLLHSPSSPVLSLKRDLSQKSNTLAIKVFKGKLRRSNSVQSWQSVPVTIKGTKTNHVPMGFFDYLRSKRNIKLTSMKSNVESLPISRNSSMDNNSFLSFPLNKMNSLLTIDTSTDTLWVQLSEEESVYRAPSKTSIMNPLHRKDVFYAGSIMNLKEYQSQTSLASYRQTVINTNPLQDVDIVDQRDMTSSPVMDKSKGYCTCLPESLVETISQMLDMSLMKDPVFLVIIVSNALAMLGFYVPFVFLIDFATTKGVEPSKAALLISVIGLTNTVGRILSGVMADRQWLNPLKAYNMSLFLTGVVVISTPFATSFLEFLLISSAFGFFSSAFIALTSIVLVELLGLDKLTNSFGLLVLFRGAACMVGPPIAGSISDASGGYELSFYLGGVAVVLAAILSFLAPVIKETQVQTKKNIEEDIFSNSPAAV